MEFDLKKFLSIDNSKVIQEDEIHRYSMAPMLDISNRYFRVLSRFLSRKATLYTEMINCETILHCKDLDRMLEFDPIEKPVVF